MKLGMGLVLLSGVLLTSCGVFNVNVQVHDANPPTGQPRVTAEPASSTLLPGADFTPTAQNQPSNFKLMEFVAVCPGVGEICIGYIWIQNVGSLYPAARSLQIMHPPTYTICMYEGNEPCLGMIKDNWMGDFRKDADYNLSWDTSRVLTGPDHTVTTDLRIQHPGVYKFSLQLFDEFPSIDTTLEYGPEIASRIVLVTVK